jgi:molybdate transport system substrate-binding protein
LAELARSFTARAAQPVAIESVGGVDAAKRVREGESFDVVVLAGNAIDELLGAGRLLAGTKTDILRSGVAVAVRAGAPRPNIDTADALKRALLGARSIGRSTGPSGIKLMDLFERWGILDMVRDRVVVAPPGVSVGALIARGDVELGFQQLSELIGIQGVDVVGPMPPAVQIVTTFSAAVGAGSTQRDSARALLSYITSPETAEAKRRRGMEPA